MAFALGIVAALAAPLVMTMGFIVWDNNWTGSTFALNLFKCNLASTWFLIVSFATRSSDPFPSTVFTISNVGFLMLSAVLGILIGDLLWLEGLRLLGARRAIIVDTIKPFFAALMGWLVLGEALQPPAFAGMVLTVGGVLLVSLEKAEPPRPVSELENEEQEEVIDTQQPCTNIVGATVLHDTQQPNATEEEEEEDDPISSVYETRDIEQSDSDVVGSKTYETDSSLAVKTPISDDSHHFDSTAENSSSMHSQSPAAEPKRHGSLRDNRSNSTASLRRGYVMAVLNVALDTYGSVLTKQYGVGMSTWEISLIRFGFAGASMLLVTIVFIVRAHVFVDKPSLSTTTTDAASCTDKSPWYLLPSTMTRMGWTKICAGVALVTFLTPALSNYALFQVALALSLTLTSIGPLYALPLTWWFQNDLPTVRACAGALMAVTGVVVLSLFGTLQ